MYNAKLFAPKSMDYTDYNGLEGFWNGENDYFEFDFNYDENGKAVVPRQITVQDANGFSWNCELDELFDVKNAEGEWAYSTGLYKKV